jgi:hypothetical protein
LSLDIQQRSCNFFTQYDAIDVVLGGDHGQRKFRMVIRVIYRNKSNRNIPAFSHTLKIGHIDCIKDTREVLERTIGIATNDGCKALFGKFMVLDRGNHTVSIHDESPLVNEVYDLNFIALPVNIFITGDLAFYATVLGKENMGGIWCPWCMLSK